MRELFAEDCVFVDGRGERHEGPDGFVEEYSKGWSTAFSDAQITGMTYYDAGDTVVVEFVGRGTSDGPLGPLPASRRPGEVPYVEISHFSSDRKDRGQARLLRHVEHDDPARPRRGAGLRAT